jgi:hypothetical protein
LPAAGAPEPAPEPEPPVASGVSELQPAIDAVQVAAKKMSLKKSSLTAIG